jgi:hypothetical protein
VSSSAGPLEVCLTPPGVEELETLFESELRHRRTFVAGTFDLGDRARCVLVIQHPLGTRFKVGAEAVYIKREEPGAGVGLDLIELDAAKLAELEAFVHQSAAEPPAGVQVPRTLYDRIRNLTMRQRDTVARQGTLSERVALERTFGSSVWEALLQNPQLTTPELSRIAKNGRLPVPLVSVIVANGVWLASSEVRRALLSNPRVAGAHLDRVLRALPPVELKQIAQMSPYRIQVRSAAKKLISE